MVLVFLCLFAVAAGMHFRLSGRDRTAPEVEERLAAVAVPGFERHAHPSSGDPEAGPLPKLSGQEAPLPVAIPVEVSEPPVPLPPETAGTESAPVSAPRAFVLSGAPLNPGPAVTEPAPEDKTGEQELLSESETGGNEGILPQKTTLGPRKRNPPKTVIKGRIAAGDTAEKLFAPYVSGQVFRQVLAASLKKHPLTRIRAGQNYTLIRSVPVSGGNPEGELESFEYEIDNDKRLLISRSGKNYTAVVEPIRYEYRLATVSGFITSSLFKAIAETGENPDLAMRLAEIFASEINFIRDLRPGDGFVLVLEKRYRDGEFRNYGKVLAARFVNRGTVYEGYRFRTDLGFERYFNAKGESLQKTLLKAPLPFTRITSGYSMNRNHPIYFENRPHQGVDYGAPKGTPVNAVGDGVVTRAGWGNGFGNMVVLKHNSSLESMYSHLSGFARGLKPGNRVRQGQIIGYVGSTGVATGPHLDFRLKQNGKYVNPVKVTNPRSEPVSRKQSKAFQNRVARLRSYLDGKQAVNTLRSEKSFF